MPTFTTPKSCIGKAENVNNVYGTAINLIILQMDYGYLPIYQR